MRALVTGANGHLGYNLTAALVERGHFVRASVRSITDPDKTARLRILGGVELAEAALERPDQLRAAMEGIEVLFHAAAVYQYVAAGREREIIDASVKGTETTLRAAADARVRRVVLTSSMVTLPLTRPGAPAVDETCWTEDLRVPYVRAKTEGERTAWRLARELGLDLVAILPGAITGPGFVRNTPSIDMIEAMMRGAMRMGVPDANFPAVDVRDVVAAHLLVAERDCAGRFVVCNDTLPSFRAMLETLHALDPRIPLPLMTLPGFALPAMPLFDRLNHATLGSPRIAAPELMAMIRGRIWNASNRRAREELGWRQSVSLEQSLRDTVETLKRRR